MCGVLRCGNTGAGGLLCGWCGTVAECATKSGVFVGAGVAVGGWGWSEEGGGRVEGCRRCFKSFWPVNVSEQDNALSVLIPSLDSIN